MTGVNGISIINISPSSTAFAAASFTRHVIMSSTYVIISFIIIVLVINKSSIIIIIIIIIDVQFKLVTLETAPGTSTTLPNP